MKIRPIHEEDLRSLWELIYGEENPEWKKWDAPYFAHKPIDFKSYYDNRESILFNSSKMVIEVNDKIIGTVNYYWEHKPSNWLESGIVIFHPDYWGNGYGTEAFALWIDHLFNSLDLVRVGATTWSGNKRMIKLGRKLGMIIEGRLRKCRYFDGQYYDSIRMGILKEEWEILKQENNYLKDILANS
ncbi:GNAT family protein [Bacillus badius]|uniref:GNAT family N-acetyltransferase n=1 Tax=Bacillus badius TaxID=1455 RepID=UPI002E1E726C|nr:GNAT family protein [Bacillus badius]